MSQSTQDLWGEATDSDLNLCAMALDNFEKGKQENDLPEVEIEDLVLPPAPRPARMRYRRTLLMVTDFVKQSWCEQAMEYDTIKPIEEKILEIEPVHIEVGRSIHLARELEVSKKVLVKTESREDKFAIKIINILHMIFGFLNLRICIVREVPIFGIPYDSNIYVTGIIDEIRFDPTNFKITLVELKTRTVNNVPSENMAKGHHLQAMLYKYLFNNLIRNKISKNDIQFHMRLNLTKELSPQIIEHTKMYSEPLTKPPSNLDELLDKLFVAAAPMPLISKLLIEYRNQGDNSLIGFTEVRKDEIWLEETMNHYFKFWKMERELEGVTLQDVWKCNKCCYIEKCEWRRKKHEEITGVKLNANEINPVPSTSSEIILK